MKSCFLSYIYEYCWLYNILNLYYNYSISDNVKKQNHLNYVSNHWRIRNYIKTSLKEDWLMNEWSLHRNRRQNVFLRKTHEFSEVKELNLNEKKIWQLGSSYIIWLVPSWCNVLREFSHVIESSSFLFVLQHIYKKDQKPKLIIFDG